MMLSRKARSRDAIIAEVIRRATIDRAFRQRLLREPNAALADVLGRPVPNHIKIRCIEKDPDVDALIVLPHMRETPVTAELQDTAERPAPPSGLPGETD